MENMTEDGETNKMIHWPTFHSPVFPSVNLWTGGGNTGNATVSFDGDNLTSHYSVPVFGLMQLRHYKMHIRACTDDACSKQISMAFRTTLSRIPNATITRIFANDANSIHLEWSIPRSEELIHLGLKFEVRVYNNGVFRLISTAEMALKLTDLSSSVEYQVEVRPSLEVLPGRRKYGNPDRATVRTWPLVLLPPTLSINGFKNGLDVMAVSWIFVNSTVLNVEVAINSSDFVKCGTSSACDLVVLYGWNSSFKAGFIKISKLKVYDTCAIDMRGCNNHGCGDPTTINVTTGISEPSEPVDLQLGAEDNVTAILTWKPPLKLAGPLTGYLVSWDCGNGYSMAATTSEGCLTVSGLGTHILECSFAVSAYHVGDDGEELRGKPATITRLSPSWTPIADLVLEQHQYTGIKGCQNIINLSQDG
ncbi:uncharacterized protein LOC144139577 [Haemaphysalis longicornis]